MPSRTRAKKSEEDDDSDDDDSSKPTAAEGDPGKYGLAASSVTLSGLLNAIDGVASQVSFIDSHEPKIKPTYDRRIPSYSPPQIIQTDLMMLSSDQGDSTSTFLCTMPAQLKLPTFSNISTLLRNTRKSQISKARKKQATKASSTKKTSMPMLTNSLPTFSTVDPKCPWLLYRVSCSGTRNIPRELWRKLRLGRRR